MRLNFSENAIKVFSEMKTDYESMNNLMQDLALGKEIYDNKNKKVVSNSEANSKILTFSKKILGITSEKPTRKEIRRAFRDNGREWFDIIEDTIDVVVSTGFDESEWFNALSETRNIARGDRQDFYVNDECILVNSGRFNGLLMLEAHEIISKYLAKSLHLICRKKVYICDISC